MQMLLISVKNHNDWTAISFLVQKLSNSLFFLLFQPFSVDSAFFCFFSFLHMSKFSFFGNVSFPWQQTKWRKYLKTDPIIAFITNLKIKRNTNGIFNQNDCPLDIFLQLKMAYFKLPLTFLSLFWYFYSVFRLVFSFNLVVPFGFWINALWTFNKCNTHTHTIRTYNVIEIIGKTVKIVCAYQHSVVKNIRISTYIYIIKSENWIWDHAVVCCICLKCLGSKKKKQKQNNIIRTTVVTQLDTRSMASTNWTEEFTFHLLPLALTLCIHEFN